MHKMTGFSCLFLFGLCLVYPSEGTVYSPPGGNRLVVAPGSNVSIQWSFDDNIKAVISRIWRFIPASGSIVTLAVISFDEKPVMRAHSLRIEIKPPATLVLKNVDENYNGTYQFSLTIDTGPIPSDVTVLIAKKPTVTVNCSGTITLEKGDNIVCLCEGKDGNPPAKVTWYKENVQIGETGNEEQTLTRTNVDQTHKGTYICVAKGHELAQDNTSIELIVNFAPENVDVEFPTKMAERGKPYTITCKAEAYPPPTFKIFYNETKLLINGEKYTIPNVNDSHSGFYHCVAKNNLGSSNSTTRYLSVGNVVETETSGSDGLSGGAIAGIVIGVLVVVVIVAGVIYWFKFKTNGKDHGSRKDTEEKAKKKRGDENVYDAVNMDDKASGSRSSHELESPMNYAVLDKNALKTDAPKKPERNAEESTAYASIDVGKVGQVEADLV